MLISIQVADMLSSPSTFFKGIASTGAKIWLFGYLLIVVISLPFMAIESLKKRSRLWLEPQLVLFRLI